ncbi:hypothetical protein EVAR_91137_1 [Eumeta japonica]|uniref:Uncharacterized protein n=1 Tax=Eumeta variegata TaxID=151549 RepID=A0A4C2A5R7_EUMVA|nr:hypothetical protein EVAR_91137_1 [Eumeta japonica]
MHGGHADYCASAQMYVVNDHQRPVQGGDTLHSNVSYYPRNLILGRSTIHYKSRDAKPTAWCRCCVRCCAGASVLSDLRHNWLVFSAVMLSATIIETVDGRAGAVTARGRPGRGAVLSRQRSAARFLSRGARRTFTNQLKVGRRPRPEILPSNAPALGLPRFPITTIIL